jgi:hypothetical protein
MRIFVLNCVCEVFYFYFFRPRASMWAANPDTPRPTLCQVCRAGGEITVSEPAINAKTECVNLDRTASFSAVPGGPEFSIIQMYKHFGAAGSGSGGGILLPGCHSPLAEILNSTVLS